jgi:two-component sensor histidine kinase/CheY-like chemotaxis protein
MPKIFIADDNEANRYTLNRILTSHGFEVTTARDGEELLQLIEEQTPDLIITDVSMPKKDGFEAVNEIRREKSFLSIPIIFISATYQDMTSRIKGIDIGANDYISVPYDEDELISKIKSMLRTKVLYDDLRYSEKQLKNALQEKEILLKEINHRVKNNFQLVSSLLNLATQQIKDDLAILVIKESADRIHTMSLIHEKLYQSESLADINIDAYIRELSNQLFNTYVIDKEKIKLSVDVKELPLTIDQAIQCGLIINELVTNSLKYGFPDNRKGQIKISFDFKENKYTLIVSDDGIGLSENFNMETSNSFGLMLVSLLTKQLNGDIELQQQNSASFKITFPE